MATLSEGKVVAVLRQCRGCGQWKRLAHFLLWARGGQVKASLHMCATCRR